MNQHKNTILGRELLRRNQIEEAESFFAAAALRSPYEQWVLEGLARTARKARDIPSAVSRYRKLIRSFPNHPEGRLELAAVLEETADHEAAASLYMEHLDRNAAHAAKAMDGLLRTLFRQGHFEQAEQIARAVADMDGSEWSVRARQILANIAVLRQPPSPPTTSVDNIISLGGKCEVAWHLRLHYDLHQAYPFDWWITPYRSMRRMIENDFRGIFEDFSIKDLANGNNTALCHKYDVLYHHDFARPSKRIELKNISEQAAAAREKYAYLTQRLRQTLQQGQILLVHMENIPHPPLSPCTESISDGELVDFMGMLEKRFGNPNLHLLFITQDGHNSRFGNVTRMTIQVHDDTTSHFASHFRGWAELLYSCGYDLASCPAPQEKTG